MGLFFFLIFLSAHGMPDSKPEQPGKNKGGVQVQKMLEWLWFICAGMRLSREGCVMIDTGYEHSLKDIESNITIYIFNDTKVINRLFLNAGFGLRKNRIIKNV